MSELCKHGIRNMATNLPYCRRCDAEMKGELDVPAQDTFYEMKSKEEWATELADWTSGNLNHTLDTIQAIQADAYKAGQAATMRWVSEECKKVLASIPVEHHHHD